MGGVSSNQGDVDDVIHMDSFILYLVWALAICIQFVTLLCRLLRILIRVVPYVLSQNKAKRLPFL